VAIDGGAAYVEVQARLIGAVETPGADVGVAVPACPGWSVHDVLAHHVGVVAGVAAGDLGEFNELVFDLLEQWRDREVQRTERRAATAAG
jgi:hypothetical protein